MVEFVDRVKKLMGWCLQKDFDFMPAGDTKHKTGTHNFCAGYGDTQKSGVTIVNGEDKADKGAQTYERQDFWATTANKQLNFLQHVKTLLKINAKAVIVVPDNVLFEGRAGETVRKNC